MRNAASRLVVLATALLSVFVTRAATVNQSSTMVIGESWHTNSKWNWVGAGIAAGSYANNDFVTPATMVLRTVPTGSTFAGGSLSIYGFLALKADNNRSYTHTVNDLRLSGASIQNYTSGAGYTQTLAGSVFIAADSEVYASAAEARHIAISAVVKGSGVMNHRFGTGNVTYSNAGNAFAGIWRTQNGNLIFTSVGAVGAGSIEISGGSVEIRGDWDVVRPRLTVTGGTVKLGAYTWHVHNVTLGATRLPNGVYSAAALNSYGAGTFTGTGQIVVRWVGTAIFVL